MKNDSYHILSDRYLLTLLKDSDSQAFTEIYNRYWEKLLFIGAVKLGELQVAEELVQDIFLDIWNRRVELEITGELEAYLAVSMKYRVINAQVKRKRKMDYEQQALSQFSEADDSTQNWLAFDELKERLEKMVTQLPEKCRITFRLSREHGLSHKEIANQMEISEKTVQSNLGRAIKMLRNRLNRSLFFFFL